MDINLDITFIIIANINPFVPNALFHHRLKTSENPLSVGESFLRGFWSFFLSILLTLGRYY